MNTGILHLAQGQQLKNSFFYANTGAFPEMFMNVYCPL